MLDSSPTKSQWTTGLFKITQDCRHNAQQIARANCVAELLLRQFLLDSLKRLTLVFGQLNEDEHKSCDTGRKTSKYLVEISVNTATRLLSLRFGEFLMIRNCFPKIDRCLVFWGEIHAADLEIVLLTFGEI